MLTGILKTKYNFHMSSFNIWYYANFDTYLCFYIDGIFSELKSIKTVKTFIFNLWTAYVLSYNESSFLNQISSDSFSMDHIWMMI